jgi:DNA-binding beta-propeller fold protein YncE
MRTASGDRTRRAYAHRIRAIGPDGRLQGRWGGPFGVGIYSPFNGWFAVATSVSIGPDGSVFVADFYNDRVQKFAPDGTFLTAFGESGDGPGQLGHAIAVAVAEDGTVFVADFLNNRIQKWQPRQ